MQHRLSRRHFLKGACALGLGGLTSKANAALPGKTVRHACIGLGGMGKSDFANFVSHPGVKIVALCDIDLERSSDIREAVPGAKFYQDWRELLANERIDSVSVTTPDHMHAAITMTALNLGRHVYCQKPLTHNIQEARRIGEKAEKSGLVTQMGTQLASSLAERIALRWIREGEIGRVREVFLWSNKQPHTFRPVGPRPDRVDPVPQNVKWGYWLGVAPERPYAEDTYHPGRWRGWQDFGCGWLGDMGCHIMDTPFRALDLGFPLSVRAEVEPAWADNPARRRETYPLWQVIEYIFPGTGFTATDALKVTWSDGGKYPPDELRALIGGLEWPEQGTLMIGEDGVMLKPHQAGPRVFFDGQPKPVTVPKLEPENHYRSFIDAIIKEEPSLLRSAFPYAARSTEMVLLGTIAVRFPGQVLAWDGASMRFPKVEAANRYVGRKYRAGWEVKGL